MMCPTCRHLNPNSSEKVLEHGAGSQRGDMMKHDFTQLETRIGEQRWQNAKTYEKTAPHEYFIDKWNPALFAALRDAINTHGVKEKFQLTKTSRVYTYKYLYLGGYRYWNIGAVLNRTVQDQSHTPEKRPQQMTLSEP